MFAAFQSFLDGPSETAFLEAQEDEREFQRNREIAKENLLFQQVIPMQRKNNRAKDLEHLRAANDDNDIKVVDIFDNDNDHGEAMDAPKGPTFQHQDTRAFDERYLIQENQDLQETPDILHRINTTAGNHNVVPDVDLNALLLTQTEPYPIDQDGEIDQRPTDLFEVTPSMVTPSIQNQQEHNQRERRISKTHESFQEEHSEASAGFNQQQQHSNLIQTSQAAPYQIIGKKQQSHNFIGRKQSAPQHTNPISNPPFGGGSDKNLKPATYRKQVHSSKSPPRQMISISERELEARLASGTIYNDEDDKMLLEDTMLQQDGHSLDQRPGSTKQSLEANSFNRLYYEGLQQKISRQQAAEDQEANRSELEISQMQDMPKIDRISDAVAKQMTQRPKKAEQFQKYSTEWLKLRDAKVEEKRLQKIELEREKSQTRTINAESRKYLPADYKGPISGYYEQVNRYFDRKNEHQEKGIAHAKQLSVPQINKSSLKRDVSADNNPNETVEQRLLRKGKEYQTRKVQKLHEQITEESVFGPQYKPKLVSNNQAYLPDRGQVRYQKIVNDNTSQPVSPLPQNLSAHEMLYYDAMVGMVQKQQKIVDKNQEQSLPQQPFINEKSRQLAGDRTLKDLFVPKKAQEHLASQDKYSKQQQRSKSPITVSSKVEVDDKDNGSLVGSQAKKKQAQVNNFLQRNYEQENKKKADRQRKNEELREKEAISAREHAHPQICEGSKRMVGNKNKQGPTFQQLFSAAKNLQARKDQLAEKHKQLVLQKEQAEFSYTPQLTHQQENKRKIMQNSLNRQPQTNKYLPIKTQQESQQSSYSQKHYQKMIYHGQSSQIIQQQHEVGYGSDSNQEIIYGEATSLMMMIPNQGGTIGQGLSSMNPLNQEAVSFASNSAEQIPTVVAHYKRQTWANRIGKFQGQENNSPEQESPPQMALQDQMIFDDETADILQSYPKTTLNNDSQYLQRTIDSGYSGLNLTQRMALTLQQTDLANQQERGAYQDEDNKIKGMLSDDQTSSQEIIMSGSQNGMTNLISEARKAIIEYEQEEQSQLEVQQDDHINFSQTQPVLIKPQPMMQQPEVYEDQSEDKPIGLVTPPARHTKSPSVTQIQKGDEEDQHQNQSSELVLNSRANQQQIGTAKIVASQYNYNNQQPADKSKLRLDHGANNGSQQESGSFLVNTQNTPNIIMAPQHIQPTVQPLSTTSNVNSYSGSVTLETFGSDEKSRLRQGAASQQEMSSQQVEATSFANQEQVMTLGQSSITATPEASNIGGNFRDSNKSGAVRGDQSGDNTDMSLRQMHQQEFTPEMARQFKESQQSVQQMSHFVLKDQSPESQELSNPDTIFSKPAQAANSITNATIPDQQNRFQQMIDEAAQETTVEQPVTPHYNNQQANQEMDFKELYPVEGVSEVNNSALISQPIVIEESEGEYGERTPQPTHYQRMIDKTLSQIDEEAESDGYSHNLRSQATPVTPIQYIDQSADEISPSPLQYLMTSAGGTRQQRSDNIHFNLSQQLSGSFVQQKTRNPHAVAGTSTSGNTMPASGSFVHQIPSQPSND